MDAIEAVEAVQTDSFGTFFLSCSNQKISRVMSTHSSIHLEPTKKLVPINIIGLPLTAIAIIFTLLDDESFLVLREISKAVKQIIDHSILKFRTTSAFLEISRSKQNNAEFAVFCQGTDFNFWKIVFAHITTLTNTSLKIGDDFLKVSMKIEQLRCFLHNLKSRTGGAIFNKIEFVNVNSEIIRPCANFLAGRNVNFIDTGKINADNFDFCDWMELVRKTNVSEINCAFSFLNKDCSNFIADLAEMVDTLTIYATADLHSSIDVVSFVKGILLKNTSHKGNNLEICSSFHIFTLSELENLLKIIQTANKYIALMGVANSNPIDVRVGTYNVLIFDEPVFDETRFYISPI